KRQEDELDKVRKQHEAQAAAQRAEELRLNLIRAEQEKKAEELRKAEEARKQRIADINTQAERQKAIREQLAEEERRERLRQIEMLRQQQEAAKRAEKAKAVENNIADLEKERVEAARRLEEKRRALADQEYAIRNSQLLRQNEEDTRVSAHKAEDDNNKVGSLLESL
nr:hypothetical protein [Eubacteriales bacterium]